MPQGSERVLHSGFDRFHTRRRTRHSRRPRRLWILITPDEAADTPDAEQTGVLSDLSGNSPACRASPEEPGIPLAMPPAAALSSADDISQHSEQGRTGFLFLHLRASLACDSHTLLTDVLSPGVQVPGELELPSGLAGAGCAFATRFHVGRLRQRSAGIVNRPSSLPASIPPQRRDRLSCPFDITTTAAGPTGVP
jgi:hypothetical protein